MNRKQAENQETNKRNSGGKQVVLGIVVIVISVCLATGGFYLYQKNQDAKQRKETTTTYKETKINNDNIKEQVNNKVDNDANVKKDKSETTENVNDTSTQGEDKLTVDEESTTPKDEKKKASPCKVRGIYVTGPMAGTKNGMKELIELVDSTELNTMVIDLKNDSGEVTCKIDNDTAIKIKATRNYISDINKLISELKKKNIYLIARIVAFKDPLLAEKKPELSIKNSDGTIFRDSNKEAWVNPYEKEVWKYLVSLGKNAAELGFDEVQFDYIRFSTDSKMKNVDFGSQKKSKIEVITEFTKYAYENLSPLGVYVSADVYGTIIHSKVDAKIVGQSYAKMSKYLDYICPMIYPSHYRNGVYGISYPDLEPYKTIKCALENSKKVLKKKKENQHQAIVRPWLQDFTASWVKEHKTYGAKELKQQIKAVYDTGYDEWILWNGKNRYTKAGLEKTN